MCKDCDLVNPCKEIKNVVVNDNYKKPKKLSMKQIFIIPKKKKYNKK